MIVKCKNCQQNFDKSSSQIASSPNHFCCRSCAATYNNKIFKKRKPEGKCLICNIPISSSLRRCFKHKRTLRPLDTTIEDLLNKRGSPTNLYAAIRDHARQIAKRYNLLNKCKVCNYNTHVVTCHIKPISSYSKDTLISVVNDVTNLIGLCPNHHWELDHCGLDITPYSNI